MTTSNKSKTLASTSKASLAGAVAAHLEAQAKAAEAVAKATAEDVLQAVREVMTEAGFVRSLQQLQALLAGIADPQIRTQVGHVVALANQAPNLIDIKLTPPVPVAMPRPAAPPSPDAPPKTAA